MIVEAGDPVPWSKPEDIEFGPNKPIPELYCVFKDGFRGAMCDGSVHWFDKNIDRDKLRALITRNGGEQVNLFEER